MKKSRSPLRVRTEFIRDGVRYSLVASPQSRFEDEAEIAAALEKKDNDKPKGFARLCRDGKKRRQCPS